jgi:hypothetical protein
VPVLYQPLNPRNDKTPRTEVLTCYPGGNNVPTVEISGVDCTGTRSVRQNPLNSPPRRALVTARGDRLDTGTAGREISDPSLGALYLGARLNESREVAPPQALDWAPSVMGGGGVLDPHQRIEKQGMHRIPPLAIDLFCGLGGWTEGLLAEGFHVIGFDIEQHVYGEHRYPAQLVLQDVRTLHGRQFRDAALIVASPPCQAYSWRAMPWKKAKGASPPDNTLFETCFRIQREASEAAGRHIPMVVENVKGAQKWVGRARWHYGSYYLWGDVPALMPMALKRGVKVSGLDWSKYGQPGYRDGPGKCFRDSGIKNESGSWFRVSHNKVKHSRGDTITIPEAGIKHAVSGHAWYRTGHGAFSSRSDKRKMASAMIAKIPLPLAQYIARVYA